MKLFGTFAVAVAGLALAAGTANAWGDKGCSSCGHSGLSLGRGHGWPAPTSLFSHNKPTFQAAPWYNYWPYDAHFLTPAPVTGAFYGPPLPGNFPVNPYFPGPAAPYGYGPMPGGPAPLMAPPAR